MFIKCWLVSLVHVIEHFFLNLKKIIGKIIPELRLLKMRAVKSSHFYIYRAFYNADGVKAVLQYKQGNSVSKESRPHRVPLARQNL